jgi:xanthine dehydrogenase YagR molybdenum-binding subunit
MFNSVGLRQRDLQRMRIATDGGGKITAIRDETTTRTAQPANLSRAAADASMMYDAPNAKITYKVLP